MTSSLDNKIQGSEEKYTSGWGIFSYFIFFIGMCFWAAGAGIHNTSILKFVILVGIMNLIANLLKRLWKLAIGSVALIVGAVSSIAYNAKVSSPKFDYLISIQRDSIDAISTVVGGITLLIAVTTLLFGAEQFRVQNKNNKVELENKLWLKESEQASLISYFVKESLLFRKNIKTVIIENLSDGAIFNIQYSSKENVVDFSAYLSAHQNISIPSGIEIEKIFFTDGRGTRWMRDSAGKLEKYNSENVNNE